MFIILYTIVLFLSSSRFMDNTAYIDHCIADPMDSSPIVMLYEPVARRAPRPHGASALNVGLRSYGFHIGTCDAMQRLPHYIDGRSDACLVLGGSLAQNCVAASHVRAHAPELGILALVPSVTASVLIQVLQDRNSVVLGKGVSVPVYTGGGRIFIKKQRTVV